MRQICEKCGRSYNDEHHSTICPHPGIGFCAVCDCALCVCVKETCADWERSTASQRAQANPIEGRAMFYNFNFRFRGRAEETLLCPAPKCFHLQGVIWKAKFPVLLKVWSDGKIVLTVSASTKSDAMPFPVMPRIDASAAICVEVSEVKRHWFRRNSVHITLEGLEE